MSWLLRSDNWLGSAVSSVGLVVSRTCEIAGSLQREYVTCGGVGLVPEGFGDFQRIDSVLVPPHSFIAASVQLMVMHSAKRHGEAVAHLTSCRPALREFDMMGIRRRPAADKAGLTCHIL